MPTEIFVFGSNTQGRHGAGAAKDALLFYGAVYGQARGMQGCSYAIVTKELRPNYKRITLDNIEYEVNLFLGFAKDNPELDFKVTKIGCGLAGFSEREIAPLFKNATENVHLPYTFEKIIEELADA